MDKTESSVTNPVTTMEWLATKFDSGGEVGALQASFTTMLSTLKQALDDWPDWESGEPVNGGDMVEWFGNWRELAKAAIAKAEGR